MYCIVTLEGWSLAFIILTSVKLGVGHHINHLVILELDSYINSNFFFKKHINLETHNSPPLEANSETRNLSTFSLVGVYTMKLEHPLQPR